jgi:hypothetical protein
MLGLCRAQGSLASITQPSQTCLNFSSASAGREASNRPCDRWLGHWVLPPPGDPAHSLQWLAQIIMLLTAYDMRC